MVLLQAHAADALEQHVAPDGKLNALGRKMVMNLPDILAVSLANILVSAQRAKADGIEQFVVPGMNHLGFQEVDVFVINLKQQFVALRIGWAIGVGPLLAGYLGKLLVHGQQVVAMGERGEFGNQFDVVLPNPAREVGHFFFFEKASIRGVLMG